MNTCWPGDLRLASRGFVGGMLARTLLLAVALMSFVPSEAATNAIPWRVPNYTLTAREMPVRDALDTFGVAEGLPVVASEAVGGVISGAFKDIPAAEFLDRIATVNNLTWYCDGASLYVYGASEVQTMLLDLRYMKADEVRALLAELGVEDARFPIRTASNGEMIMVSGPPRYVALISEMIARADKLREQRTFTEVETRIFPLRNTWADTVSISVSSPESSASIRGIAQILEELMLPDISQKVKETDGTNVVSQSGAEAGTAQYRPVIRPENRLNAVIVRDIATRMPMYERLISQLDVPQKLVEIAVTTVELTKRDALDWQLSLRVAGTKDDFSGGAGQNAQNLTAPEAIAGQGLVGAATYLGSHATVEASLAALRTKGKARRISHTTLVTMDNLAAEMSDSQSYHARVVGDHVASLEEVTAGTSLRMKPHLVPTPGTNGQTQVWMTIDLQDGGFETVAVDSMPMKRASTVRTQMAVFEAESVMIAGYMRDIDEKSGWGIPYLRDIPWIGWLFGGKSINRETVQRMFILTPRIVDLDAESLVRLQATRLRDIREEERIEQDVDDQDDQRRLREIEREDRRERYEEEAADRLERREAELKRDRELRQIEREGRKADLDEDKARWARQVEEAERRMEEERNKKP